MAKFGLPVYPIFDEMNIERDQPREEIEWLLEYGMFTYDHKPSYNVQGGSVTKVYDPALPKSPAGLPLYWMDITKYNGKYAFITGDDAFKGDDPQPEHYILHWYETLDELREAQHLPPTWRGPDIGYWKWLDCKPDLLVYYLEEV